MSESTPNSGVSHPASGDLGNSTSIPSGLTATPQELAHDILDALLDHGTNDFHEQSGRPYVSIQISDHLAKYGAIYPQTLSDALSDIILSIKTVGNIRDTRFDDIAYAFNPATGEIGIYFSDEFDDYRKEIHAPLIEHREYLHNALDISLQYNRAQEMTGGMEGRA